MTNPGRLNQQKVQQEGSTTSVIGHPKARDNGLPTTKKLFFTVITGNYDALRQPCVVSDGWEYVCFTDKAASGRHGVWQMVDVRDKLSRFPRDPKKRAAMISIRYFDFVDSGKNCIMFAFTFYDGCIIFINTNIIG